MAGRDGDIVASGGAVAVRQPSGVDTINRIHKISSGIFRVRIPLFFKDQPGGPSSPFLPFFFAGSASRGRLCAGVAAGTTGSVFLGGSVVVRGSAGSSGPIGRASWRG